MSLVNLSQLIAEAKKNLHEDETRKRQSLQAFREWIEQHPFIRRCRKDDAYLISFLRTRKYSLSEAYATFERNLLMRERRPQWFDASPSRIALYKDLCRSGLNYGLADLDLNGVTTYILNIGRFDIDKYGSDEAFGISYLSAGLMDEGDTMQLLGFSYVLDCTNGDKRYYELCTPKKMLDFATSLNVMPGRFCKIFVIALPPLYGALLNIAKLVMSEKMRSRLICLRASTELADYIDPKILPEKFGGVRKESEIIESFIGRVDKFAAKLRESNDFDIDVDGLSGKKEKAGGDRTESFRKLEID